jgi:5,10-methylenetetrahydrofolate reductase
MQLREKFDAGQFAVLAEMEPPKGVDVSPMVGAAQRVKQEVDAFVVPEMSNAVMRMSSLGGAMLLRNKGMEAIMQANCRDRNRIALQADLLAAWAAGVNTVVAVTGEEPGYGDHHQARAVYDIDLVQLLQTVDSLNGGRDMAGIELSGAPDFLVGTTVDAGAKGKSPELEAEEMMRRHEAGASFFITPPLFDLDAIDPFLRRIDLKKTRILPTVLLLKSVGMARYISQNVGHIFIPDTLIERIQKAPDKVGECIRVAAETISSLKQAGFGGVLIATLGWEHRLPEIFQQMRG